MNPDTLLINKHIHKLEIYFYTRVKFMSTFESINCFLMINGNILNPYARGYFYKELLSKICPEKQVL